MGLLSFIRRPIFRRVAEVVRGAVVDTVATVSGNPVATKALTALIGGIFMVAGVAIPDEALQAIVQAIIAILTWLGVWNASNRPRNPPPISQ